MGFWIFWEASIEEKSRQPVILTAWKFHHETKATESYSEGEMTMVTFSQHIPTITRNHILSGNMLNVQGANNTFFGGQKPALLGQSGFDFSHAVPCDGRMFRSSRLGAGNRNPNS